MAAKRPTHKAGPAGARKAHRPEDERGSVSLLPRHYEGPDVLSQLLSRAGAETDTKSTIERFVAAQEEGHGAPYVIPRLFPKEPRFGGPDAAMRLYANLLGLWELLEAGASPEELLVSAPPPEPEDELDASGDDAADADEDASDGDDATAAVDLPPRGSLEATPLPPAYVDAMWQHLADLPERDRRRRQDRFENVFSELAEFARAAEGLEGPGLETAEYLCFELAEMFEHAFGDRLGPVRYRDLLAADPAAAESLEPAAAAYVTESLDEAEAEGAEPLPPEERAAVESRVRAALAVLHRAVRSGSGERGDGGA